MYVRVVIMLIICLVQLYPKKKNISKIMRINIFPNETSSFKSELKSEEIHQILKENHYEGILSSTSHNTNKKYIGNVEKNYFKIILSKPKTSMFCVFEGEVNQKEFTEIVINKKTK